MTSNLFHLLGVEAEHGRTLMFEGYAEALGNRATLEPLRDALVGETRTALVVLFGGGAGLLLPAWTTELFASSLPQDIPGVADVGMGAEVLAFTLGVSD